MKIKRSSFIDCMTGLLGVALVMSGCCSKEKYPKGIEHVVVIGLDGMSSQGFKDAKKPFINNLIQNGAYTYKVRCILPTVNKPNWNVVAFAEKGTKKSYTF